jgi:hypothetical protein
MRRMFSFACSTNIDQYLNSLAWDFCISVFIPVSQSENHLCGLAVSVPGYTTEMYCASCEVRTEFICVM